MPTFDVYGFKGIGLDDVKSLVENAIGLPFTAHESSFFGEYYRHGDSAGEHFKIQLNYDPAEEEWREEEFKEYAILLYVNRTERSAAFQKALASAAPAAELLRHEDLPSAT